MAGRRWSEAEPEGGHGGVAVSGAGGRYPSELCSVVPPPGFNQELRCRQGVEDLPVEQFIPQRAVEGLAVAVFPR